MSDPRPAHVRFGPFVCDTSTGELWKAGRPVRLQEQPRQLLLALVQHPGEVMSREQLRRSLWADDTFVDFDNALNVGVRRIREALGDDAPTARFVETVRGRGYRFIAPVLPEPGTEPAPPEAAPALVPTPSVPSARVRRWGPAMALVALVAAASAAFVVWSSSRESAIDSVAVLPFDNLLGDDSSQYLVDGLGDAVRRQLGGRLNLDVIASASGLAAGGPATQHVELARQLGADALLIGSVAHAGAGVVINVRMIDGASGRMRWAGRFERSLDELTFSDEIVDAVAASIGAIASGGDRPRVARAVTPEARDAYLRGRFFWAKRGQPNSVIAVRYLSTAIQLQRDYAEAWAGLADVYAVQTGAPSPVIVPWPGDSIDAGLRAAHEAIRLDPDLGEAHAALAKLYVGRRRWSEAEQSFARAIALRPQYSTARQWYGTMLLRLRRCDEALEQVKIGARLDPLTALVNEGVGSVYLDCGEPERAVQVFDAVLMMHPSAHSTRRRRARALSQVGRHEEAIREMEAVDRAAPSVHATSGLAIAYAAGGRITDARATLAKLEAPFMRAQVLAALGDTRAMWEMLERSLLVDGGGLANLLAASEFESHRHDPRFIDFVRRAGFPMPIRDARFTSRTPAIAGR